MCCFCPVATDPGSFLTPVILVLAAHTKQFKDSNFNVLKATFVGVKTLLEAAHAAGDSKGNHAAVSMMLSPAVEKLGDRKLQVRTVLPICAGYAQTLREVPCVVYWRRQGCGRHTTSNHKAIMIQ